MMTGTPGRYPGLILDPAMMSLSPSSVSGSTPGTWQQSMFGKHISGNNSTAGFHQGVSGRNRRNSYNRQNNTQTPSHYPNQPAANQ